MPALLLSKLRRTKVIGITTTKTSTGEDTDAIEGDSDKYGDKKKTKQNERQGGKIDTD